MSLIDTLQMTPWVFVLLAAVLGLFVGSFLNVVIYRLPQMMKRAWRGQCEELLAAAGNAPAEQCFDLAVPRSHCPHCNHQLSVLENIPLLSYVALRGKCSACGAAISIRYPLIELLTALLSAVVAWQFGFGWEAAAALLLTWVLISLSVIDLDHQLLPDAITLPVLWVGLLLSLFEVFAGTQDAVIGAMAGYLSLWLVYISFKLATGKEGMGAGDFKLLALLGAWMGWQSLPVVIFMSSIVGAALGIAIILVCGRDRNLPFPFGPYLALAGWITLLWGDQIVRAYWEFF